MIKSIQPFLKEITEFTNHIEVEQALLGVLLKSPAALGEIAGIITAEDFYVNVHGRIYAAILQANANGGIATPQVLMAHIGDDPDLKLAGGAKYFMNLLKAAGLTLSVVDYARGINNLSRLRRFVAACNNGAALDPQNVTLNAASTISDHVKACETIMRSCSVSGLSTSTEVASKIAEQVVSPKHITNTGLKLLDEAMGGGLHAGKAYGFAARKKVGKTILASTISHNLNNMGIKHLFICGEMGSSEIHQRNLCRVLDMYPTTMRKGGREVANKIAEYAVSAPNYTLYKDAPALLFSDMQTSVVSAYYEHGIKGFILDYWQLVGGKDKNQSTVEHSEAVAQWIADICRKLGIWAIVMAQLNQEGNTRGGEGIRLAFDQVYQIRREDITKPATWLEMMDTRYTAWLNVGSETSPGLWLEDKGPYFSEILAYAKPSSIDTRIYA